MQPRGVASRPVVSFDRVENAAVRNVVSSTAAIARGDLGAVDTLVRPDLHYSDRRRGLQHAETLDMQHDMWKLMLGGRFDIEPVELRGNRLALVRLNVELADSGWIIGGLMLTEVDSAGLGVATILFDEDDVEAAVVELEHRYAANASEPDT